MEFKILSAATKAILGRETTKNDLGWQWLFFFNFFES